MNREAESRPEVRPLGIANQLIDALLEVPEVSWQEKKGRSSSGTVKAVATLESGTRFAWTDNEVIVATETVDVKAGRFIYACAHLPIVGGAILAMARKRNGL